MNHLKSIYIASVAAAALLLPTHALAVDGVILIDQNKALAGNVTPGDAAGFPVTISQPGSYRLSSNLIISNANTTAIQINADHVTIDLNGFAILGVTDCTGGFNPCANAGSGHGIATGPGSTPRFNLAIGNGTIQGMGNRGIFLVGDSNRVKYMSLRSNGGDGVALFASNDDGGSEVEHCTAQRNGSTGISLNRGRVSHSIADINNSGILVTTGSAQYNEIGRNAFFGLQIIGQGAYIGNVISNNGGLAVIGGVNQGQNLCDGTPCPGAQF